MHKINLVSQETYKRDPDTVYTIADATKDFIMPLTPNTTVSIQAIYTGLTGTLDGTLQIKAGNDPNNLDNYSDGLITLDSAIGSDSWTKDSFNFHYIGITFTQNNLNLAGTIKLILTFKKKHDGRD